ncbi:hypothetical protein PY254_03385 [Rhodanobacter sp. AS-Z3]|uniref:hypothetical protein n=1 Tax=Rhodanobacter sp. AS-Z3 TaxID=3031330 RepID=UPI0024793482|nr:hypothetical protein [Rhodanobacter sp. AS-Z3]WEN15731.1 hypothetical protein PY254_03385 [Rhodanobacter sp. AS-Z3]
MMRSFGLVEEKLREAEYFLSLLSESGRHSQEAKYCFSAFVSASRSVTFALQTSLTGVDGFDVWYSVAQTSLKADLLAPHFVEFRNSTQKTGENPIGKVNPENLRHYLSAQLNGTAPRHVLVHPASLKMMDASEACAAYLTSVTRIVYDCYVNFRTVVDPQWHFTKEVFDDAGMTFQDALQELGYPSSWSDAVSVDLDGWSLLRKLKPGCAINDIFYARLGQIVLGPDEHQKHAEAQ